MAGGSGPSIRRQRRVEALCCGLLLLAGFLLVQRFYWIDPAWTKLLGTTDQHRQFAPRSFFFDYWLNQGVFPLWNPLLLCGVPLAADPEAAIFYPGQWLRHFFTPGTTPLDTVLSLALYAAAHALWGGAGAYALARRHGVSKTGAYFAAFAFACSGAMTRRLVEHGNIVAVASWAPWVLFCFEGALSGATARSRARGAALAGLALGVGALAGHIDYTVYTGILLVVYATAHPSLWRASHIARLRIIAAAVGLVALSSLIAMGIAAPMLLMGAEAASLSGRAADSGVEATDITKLDQPLLGAEPYRDPVTIVENLVLFAGPDGLPSYMRGAGVAALLLAVLAAAFPQRRGIAITFAVAWLVLFEFSLAIPGGPASLARTLLPYQMGQPFRATLMMQLPFALLAGLGVDTALRGVQVATRWERWRRGAWAFVAVVALSISAMFSLGMIRHQINVSWLFLPVAFAGVALTARAFEADGRGLARLLPLVLLLEASLWTSSYLEKVYFLRPEYHFQDSIATLSAKPGLSPWIHRGFDSHPNYALFRLQPVVNGYAPVHARAAMRVLQAPWTKGSFTRRVDPDDCVAESNYGHTFLKRRFWLVDHWVDSRLPSKRFPFPPTSYVYLQDGDGPPELESPFAPVTPVSDAPIVRDLLKEPLEANNGVLTLPDIALNGRHAAIRLHPRMKNAGWAEMWFEEAAGNARAPGPIFQLKPGDQVNDSCFALPDFDRIRIHIRGDLSLLAAELLLDAADDPEAIRVTSDTPNAVDVAVRPQNRTRLLVFVDAWYPGWRAEVDGQPAKLLRANNGFKAVVAPPGAASVRFTFAPPRVRTGLMISALTLTIVAWLLRRDNYGVMR